MKKSILRKILSMALCAAIMLTLLPVTALAAVVTISAGGTYNLSEYGNGSVITISTTAPVTLIGDTATTYTNVQIECSNAGVSLTLNNVNINNADCVHACALSFTGAGNTLALDGTSALTSGDAEPGVRVQTGTALTISDGAGTGTGQLTATGGMDGAGIGGGLDGNGGTVNISGGTVTATGGDYGAGIGGGGAYLSTGETGAAVLISGGTVRVAAGSALNGTAGHAIGGGGYYGESDGSFSVGAPGTCVITGGSVYVKNSVETVGMGPFPNNGNESAIVYLTTVALGGVTAATAVDSLTTNVTDYTYGTNDMYTDAYGVVYLYLPVSTVTSAATTAFANYNGSVATTTDATASLGSLTPETADLTVAITDSVDTATPGGSVTYNITAVNVGPSDVTGATVACTLPAGMTATTWTAVDAGGATATASGSGNISDTVNLPVGSYVTYTFTANIDSGVTGTLSTTATISPPSGIVDPNTGNNSATDTDTLISADASLSSLNISQGTPSPIFTGITYTYTASVANNVTCLTVTPTANDANATITVNGTAVTSGTASTDIPLSVGANTIAIEVTAPDGTTTLTYTVYVTRAANSGGSYSPSYYIVTATAGEGGSISPSGSSSVIYDSEKTYTITADEGYEIEEVLVDGDSVGAVSSYTFENVKKVHTIAVSFTKTVVNPFTDVNADDWFYKNVLHAYKNGLMNGTGDDMFSPDNSLTRGMFVTILYRMSEDSGTYANLFHDVQSGKYYENAAAWAYENDIVRGVGDNCFAPDNNITREQMAVMLFNYAKYMGYGVSVGEDTNILSYNDALNISEYAYTALQWACGARIMTGDDSRNLNPQSFTTRAEAAAILQRFIENVTG